MSAAIPPPDRARTPGETGFTLLEVLIALAILGTAVVASIQGVSQGLRLLKTAGDQQQAVIVADQKARELVVPVEGTDGGTVGRFNWQRTSRVLETPELTPPDATPEWRMFRISVVVTWDEQRRLEVSTLRIAPATSDPTQAAQPGMTQVVTGQPGQSTATRPGVGGSMGSTGMGGSAGSTGSLPSRLGGRQ